MDNSLNPKNKLTTKKYKDFTTSEIDDYLDNIKGLIENNKLYFSNRNINKDFCDKYNLNYKKKKAILLSLTHKDFCYAADNKNVNFAHEVLYVFSVQKTLDNWGTLEEVDLYIKFNYMKNGKCSNCVVISFHELEKPIEKLFS